MHPWYELADDGHRVLPGVPPDEVWRVLNSEAYRAAGAWVFRVTEHGTRIELRIDGSPFRKYLRFRVPRVRLSPGQLDRFRAWQQGMLEHFCCIGGWELQHEAEFDDEIYGTRSFGTEAVWTQRLPIRPVGRPTVAEAEQHRLPIAIPGGREPVEWTQR